MARRPQNTFVFLFALLLLCGAECMAQAIPRTRIRAIYVNSYPLAPEQWRNIVIGRSDEISFFYDCEFSDTLQKDHPRRFIVELRDGKESVSIQRPTEQNCRYTGLDEGSWSLRIQAFSPQRWDAEPVILVFSVISDEKKRLLEQQAREAQRTDNSLENGNNTADDTTTQLKGSLPAAGKDSSATHSDTGSSFSEWGIYMGIGILTLAGLFFAVTFWKKKDPDEVQPEQRTESGSAGNGSVSRDMYEKIIIENSALRAEIASLRGQIKTIQGRTDELRRQNLELQEKVEKVSTKKQELEELQVQKDELFAVIIHDIKNPASLIKSLVELLRSYDLTAQDQQEIIEDIVETTTKIVSLSQEVSRIMAIESGEMQLGIGAFPMNEVIRDIYRRNSIAAQKKDIQFSMDVPDALPNVMMDPQKIEEVLDNLVSNAVKFTQSGGVVRIRAFAEDRAVTVEVSDTGLGLSEDDLKRAFTRGTRLSAQPTAGESSSGLGLWIVKKIIEAHKGGRVWVKSALGKGSTFAFQLPLAER